VDSVDSPNTVDGVTGSSVDVVNADVDDAKLSPIVSPIVSLVVVSPKLGVAGDAESVLVSGIEADEESDVESGVASGVSDDVPNRAGVSVVEAARPLPDVPPQPALVVSELSDVVDVSANELSPAPADGVGASVNAELPVKL